MKKFISILSISLVLAACSASQPTPPVNEFESPTGSILDIPSATEADTVYTLDTNASKLEWEASRLAASPHIGTVAVQSGSIFSKDGNFMGGEFTIDMNTITEVKNNERFLTHVKGDDFFSVDQFPSSKLVLTKVEKQSDTSYQLTGQLTIRDQTHEITFPAEINEEGEKITARSEFQIDRTRWGIIFDSGSFFTQLGDRAIKNEITYRLNLVFNK